MKYSNINCGFNNNHKLKICFTNTTFNWVNRLIASLYFVTTLSPRFDFFRMVQRKLYLIFNLILKLRCRSMIVPLSASVIRGGDGKKRFEISSHFSMLRSDKSQSWQPGLLRDWRNYILSPRTGLGLKICSEIVPGVGEMSISLVWGLKQFVIVRLASHRNNEIQ